MMRRSGQDMAVPMTAMIPNACDRPGQGGPEGPPLLARARLRRVDVLGARSLRPLADGERHVLTFPQVIKPHRAAGGLMEEIFVTVGRRNEAEALVRHALDCSVH